MRIRSLERSGSWIWLAALAVAVGCASPTASPSGTWRADPSGDLVYVPLNLRLGPRFENLVRDPTNPAALGSEVGVTYREPSEKIELTFYIYPRLRPDAAAHFQANLAEIQAAHPGAKVELAGPSPTRLAGQDVRGFFALVLYEDDQQPFATLLRVVPASDYFIQLRASTPVAQSSEASLRRIGDLSKRFLASLPLAVQ